MSKQWEAAKKAVLERLSDQDGHAESCEVCARSVNELIKEEMENRSDPLINRAKMSP